MISKTFFLTCALFSVALAASIDKSLFTEITDEVPHTYGGHSELKTERAESLLSKTFLTISNGDSNVDMKVKKIRSATYQVVSGFYYNIVADLIINGETKENCVAKILEPAVGEEAKTEITCPDGHHKQFSHTIAKRSLELVGAPRKATPEEPAKIINTYLKTLVGGPSFELYKVHSATVQLVGGSLYKIKADFKNPKGEIVTCDVKIVEQSWLTTDEAVKFQLDCPEYETISFQHKFIESK
ncbi:hypothetical protein ACFFRR_002083 [Megaselia abdita]